MKVKVLCELEKLLLRGKIGLLLLPSFSSSHGLHLVSWLPSSISCGAGADVMSILVSSHFFLVELLT